MPAEALPRGHRYSRSAAIPSTAIPSQNPQNPHHLNIQEHAQNTQSNQRMDVNATTVPAQPTTPPRTPKRNSQSASQNTANSNVRGNGSKQKARGKNRPQNVMTSPAMVKNDRNTPPLTGAQSVGMSSSAKPINTPSTAAYAGPTFHASPAPSALPIPSFYSKSVPDSPGLKGLKSVKAGPLSGNLCTPPAPSQSANQSQREESPLDFFFKADREEKARARSAVSTAAAPTGPFHPPVDSPRINQTPPASTGRSQKGYSNRISPSGMFAMELDGEREAGTPLGPAFSTPYNQRINAARASDRTARSLQQSPSTTQGLDNSEALKAYLFSDHSLLPSSTNAFPPRSEAFGPLYAANSHQHKSAIPSGSQSAGLPQRPQLRSSPYSRESRSSNNIARQFGRSSYLRQEVTPAQSSPTPSHQSNNNNYTNSSISSRPLGGMVSHSSNFNSAKSTYAPSRVSPNGNIITSSDGSADLRGMEETLRRILKIDSNVAPNPSGSSMNYVGGGMGSSVNGVH